MLNNMIWSAKDAASATRGEARGDWGASGISIDSRSVAEGDLFIALAGDNGDGHKFVADALSKGAAAAMVSHVPDDVADDAPLLVVGDTFEALQALGAASRARVGAKIIGVTGSVGKTGTKEMLGEAFSVLGQTHASAASFNNHWGVPISLSAMHAGSDFGIFEIGMNHAREITPLSKQVQPDIAIITTVAPVHIENFNSEEEIASAKAEIFDGMKEGSTAILNRDNKWFDYLSAAAEKKSIKVLSFGRHENSDARLMDCIFAANGTRVRAEILGEKVEFNLQIAGEHIACNALSVLLAVKACGEDIKIAAKELGNLEPLKGRGKREYLDIGDPDNPVTLIDESYNASPVAMRAAFKVLALIDPGRGGRRIAILGDMYEIGQNSQKEHEELSLPLQAADVQFVYTSGPMMKHLHNKLPSELRGAHEDDTSKLAQIVPDVLSPGDVVMVKGSRGGGEKPRMEVIVEALRALPQKKK